MNQYNRDEMGRYTRKANYKAISFFAFMAVIMAAYVYHITLPAKAQNSPVSATQTEQAEEMVSDCTNTLERNFDCNTDIEIMKQWKAFEDAGKPVKFTASAYTSEPRQTDSSPCISASGDDICKLHAQGMRIAASNDLPLRSTFEYAGETWHVLDRMNKRYTGTNTVDLYFGYDMEAAWKHGRKVIEIKPN